MSDEAQPGRGAELEADREREQEAQKGMASEAHVRAARDHYAAIENPTEVDKGMASMLQRQVQMIEARKAREAQRDDPEPEIGL